MRNVVMLSTLMLMFIVAGCSKDQRAVKRLDGTWQLTEENGNAVDANEVSKITFSNCKLKKDEYCTISFSYSVFGQTFSANGEYLVTDKGETLEVKTTSSNTTTIQRFVIKELTKSTLIIESTSGGVVNKEEYKKI